MDSMTEMFGEPISVFTDQDAIDDGQLVVVDERRFPGCLFTQAVHAAIMEKVQRLSKGYSIYRVVTDILRTNGVEVRKLVEPEPVDPKQAYLQIIVPLMQDVIMVAKDPKNAGESTYTGNDLDGNVTGKTLWFGMNQSGGITVMFPEDN